MGQNFSLILYVIHLSVLFIVHTGWTIWHVAVGAELFLDQTIDNYWSYLVQYYRFTWGVLRFSLFFHYAATGYA